MLYDDAWAFEHSVDCRVSVEFAWSFWTDVRNWAFDADIESVQIDGLFAPGTTGSTTSKSSGRVDWQIGEMIGRSAVIEFPLKGAVGRFRWSFEERGEGTRITQRCTIAGEAAEQYVRGFAPGLEAGIPDGMTKLCQAMEAAAQRDSAGAEGFCA